MRATLPILGLAALGIVGGIPGEAGTDEVEFAGIIEPRRIVNLSVAQEGVLEEVLVDRGDRVEEGQPVARLESSVQEASLEIARARAEMRAQETQRRVRLDLVARRHTQDEELHRRGIISEQEIFESRAEKALAEAALLEAQENLRLDALEQQRAEAILALRTIRSTVAGVVMERNLAPGDLVNEAHIVRIAEIDPLVVRVLAPVGQMRRIRPGGRATVLPEEPYDDPVAATVRAVDQVVDAASGTFRVQLEIPNPDHELPAGLKCRVRFGG